MDNQKILRLLRYILVGITFASLCLILLRPIWDPDFFWHLATGRWIIENHSLPTNDPFNYTTPALLSSREHFILTSYWLSQIFYYGIYYVSNWNGFIILGFIVLGVIIYFIYKRAKGSDKIIFFSIMAITMIVFAQIYPLERPQVFSFLFFAILLYLLERQVKVEVKAEGKDEVEEKDKVKKEAEDEVKKKLNLNLNLNLLLLPLLMLIWANMHGGYILGQGVIFVYLLAEGSRFLHPSLRPMGRSSYRRFLIAGISGILSALINPNTYKAIIEMWSISKYSSSIIIIEYQSTITIFRDYYKPYYMPVYWLLLLIAVISLLYRIMKKRFDMKDAVMLIGLGYFSFTQLRYVAFFLIWAAPFISLSLSQIIQGEASATSAHNDKTVQKPLPRYICVLLSLSIIATLIISQKEFDNVKNITNFKTGQWVNNYYPDDAVRFIIDNNIKGNMYNHYDWGGYLIWKFYPEKRVFVDGRNLYRLQYSQDMHILSDTVKPEVMGMPYYKAILESYRVKYMIMPLFSLAGEMPPIVAEMINDKEWTPVFLRGNSMVFVKDTSGNHDVIHTYSIPKDKFVAALFVMLEGKIKESPEDVRLYIAKGDLYSSQRRFKEAKKEYEKTLEINPFNGIARERLEFLNSKMQGGY